MRQSYCRFRTSPARIDIRDSKTKDTTNSHWPRLARRTQPENRRQPRPPIPGLRPATTLRARNARARNQAFRGSTTTARIPDLRAPPAIVRVRFRGSDRVRPRPWGYWGRPYHRVLPRRPPRGANVHRRDSPRSRRSDLPARPHLEKIATCPHRRNSFPARPPASRLRTTPPGIRAQNFYRAVRSTDRRRSARARTSPAIRLKFPAAPRTEFAAAPSPTRVCYDGNDPPRGCASHKNLPAIVPGSAVVSPSA